MNGNDRRGEFFVDAGLSFVVTDNALRHVDYLADYHEKYGNEYQSKLLIKVASGS